MKRRSPEHDFQCALLEYLRINGRRDLHWVAVPNGGLRHPLVAKQLKAEGVVPGTPDLIFLLEGGKAAWLELKAKRGSLSDAQRGFQARALRLDHLWGVAKTMEEAIALLRAWGVLRPRAA